MSLCKYKNKQKILHKPQSCTWDKLICHFVSNTFSTSNKSPFSFYLNLLLLFFLMDKFSIRTLQWNKIKSFCRIKTIHSFFNQIFMLDSQFSLDFNFDVFSYQNLWKNCALFRIGIIALMARCSILVKKKLSYSPLSNKYLPSKINKCLTMTVVVK